MFQIALEYTYQKIGTEHIWHRFIVSNQQMSLLSIYEPMLVLSIFNTRHQLQLEERQFP